MIDAVQSEMMPERADCKAHATGAATVIRP